MEQEKARKKTDLTALQALQKAEHYCAYQERSQQEVRNKLYDWSLTPDEVENIITELILNNFINEERFANAYVSGKFRINKWGKRKIEQGLRAKGISPKMCHNALNAIDMDEYLKVLAEILEKKAAVLSEKDAYKRKMKLASFAAGRGFENNFIFDLLNNKDL